MENSQIHDAVVLIGANDIIVADEMAEEFLKDAANETSESPLESTPGTMLSAQSPSEPVAVSPTGAGEQKISTGSVGEAKPDRKSK